MFNKVKIKHLTVVFSVLLLGVIITLLIGNNTKSRSFTSDLIQVDTSKVTSLMIYPPNSEKPVVLQKKEHNWTVSDGENTYNADNTQINQLVTTLSDLTSIRLAAKDKDRWDDYEVTDSLGTRVQLMTGDKKAAEIYVGKFTYSQPPQATNPYMQQQRGTMTSYVRMAGDKEVYAVDGFLKMMFNRTAEEFRDRNIMHVRRNKIARISFQLPGEQFTVSKSNNQWMLDGLKADSAAMVHYLSGCTYLRGTGFLADPSLAQGTPSQSVTFEDTSGVKLAKVDIFYHDTATVALVSSQNPGTVFDGTKGDLVKKLIRTKEELLGKQND